MSFAFKVGDELLDLLAFGGGEVLGELGDLCIDFGSYTVRGVFNGTFDETEDLDSHKIGAAEGDRGICRIEGMEFDVICVVDDFFDEGFVAIDEDYGDAAAIYAGLLMDLDDVAVLDLGGHTVAGDFDTDSFVCLAVGVDVYGHIFCNEVLSHYAEACADRFIDGDHASLGGIQDDGVAAERGGGGVFRHSGDGNAEVVGDLFKSGVSRNCAVFPFGRNRGGVAKIGTYSVG